MTNTLRAIYRFWAVLLFAAVVVQVGAAGYGAFSADKKARSSAKLVTHKQFDHGFGLHDGLGYLIFLASVLLFLLAAGARLGRKGVLLALAAPLLVLLQIVLAVAGESVPGVGALHPVNALVIVALTGALAHRAWRGSHAAVVRKEA